MSIFSERIREEVENTGITVYTLAKKANINRPTIHRCMKGEIVPNDHFIIKLCEAMMLTKSELDEILLLAKRARMGEPIFQRRQAVKKLINTLCYEFDDLEIIALDNHQENPLPEEGYHLYKGKNRIKSIIHEMLKNTERGKVFFNLPYEERDYFSLIYHMWMPDISLIQIIGLEKESRGWNSTVRNLGIIEYAIEFGLMRDREYAAWYHYLDHTESISEPAMPYYIKTDKGILTLSANMKTGTYYGRGEMLAYYSDMIEGILKNSKSLIYFENNAMNMYDYGKRFSLIESIPCITHVMTDDLVDDLIKKDIPQREMIREAALQFYRKSRAENQHPVSFFHLDKLADFMETGKIPTVPDVLVRPATPQERRTMLSNYKSAIDKNEERIYALNPKKIHLLKDIEVVYSEEKGIMIRKFEPNVSILKILMVKEPSCVEAFRDFYEYMPKSDLVLPYDEMRNTIDQLIQQYCENN